MSATAAQPGPADPRGAAPSPRTGAPNISVLILTGNEALNIPHSLANVVGWAGRVWVVDSESTDETPSIVKASGADLAIHPWEGFARQRNWGLDHLEWDADWILILDADETLTDGLKRELEAIAARPVDEVAEAGFYMNRLTYFMNRPLRRCGYFPNWNLRFVKRGAARYEERDVHEHLIVDGPTARLDPKALMLHNDRRGVEAYISKHVRYAMLEAGELFRATRGESAPGQAKLSGGANVRRWLKRRVLPWLPAPWLFRFLYMYVWKLGVLDGLTGFRFCLLIATYELFISLRLNELRSVAEEEERRA